MTAKSRRSVFAAFAVGIIGVLAIAASSASATSVAGNPVAFKAFVDNGFNATIVGVTGGVVNEQCSSGNSTLTLRGTQSNGQAKSEYFDESNNHRTRSADDLDTGDFIALNNDGIGREVIGHAEFINGSETKNTSVNYSVEDTPDNSSADCSVWGSLIKGTYGS